MKLSGTKWVQAYPKKLGTFDCSLEVRRPEHGFGDRHHAERQRYATQYATATVIKPQG